MIESIAARRMLKVEYKRMWFAVLACYWERRDTLKAEWEAKKERKKGKDYTNGEQIYERLEAKKVMLIKGFLLHPIFPLSGMSGDQYAQQIMRWT